MKDNIKITKQLPDTVLTEALLIQIHTISHRVGHMSLLTSRIPWLHLPFELYPLILGGCHLDHLVIELYKEMYKTFSMNKRKWTYQEATTSGSFFLGWEV